MPAKMPTVDLAKSNLNTKSTNKTQSKDDQGEFLVSLQNKLKKTDQGSKLDKKAIVKRLEKLLNKGLDKLTKEELEEVLGLLGHFSQQLKDQLTLQGNKNNTKTKDQMIQMFSQQKNKNAQGIIKTGNLNQDSLQDMIKNLEFIKEKLVLKKNNLSKIDRSTQEKLSKLKEMLSKVKGDILTEDTTKKIKQQRGIQQRIVYHSNLKKVSRDSKDRLKNNLSLQQEKLIVDTDNNNLKESELLVEKLSQGTETNNEQGLKDLDLNSINGLIDNSTQSIDNINNQSSFNKKVNFQNIMNQITDKSGLLATKKGKEVTLQLQPESLGKLQIKIGVEDGIVTAKIMAENGQVKDLLDGNLARLKTALGEKNIQIEQFDVSVDYSEENLSEDFNQSQHDFTSKQDRELDELDQFNLDLEELSELEVEGDNKEKLATNNIDNVDYVV